MARVRLLFALLCLACVVSGADSTSSTCPEEHNADGRTIWSVLETCALTLLICVWHAVHLDIPGFSGDGVFFFERAPWIFLAAFFAPEAIVSLAAKQWCEAHRQVRDFRVEGYRWSMTHSYFVQMGGFLYDDGKKSRPETMSSLEFRRRCEKGEIVNPFITEEQINAMGKSDALAKAVFIVQLSQFTVQVIARGVLGLAITLVELDTVCMCALALLYLFFWWDKPHCPQYPYTFYWTPEQKKHSKEELSKAWKAEPHSSFLLQLIPSFHCVRETESAADEEKSTSADADKADRPISLPNPSKLTLMMEEMGPVDVQIRSLYLTWIILGGLHLIAWNWDFPTEVERIIWRVASLVLVSSPLFYAVIPWIGRFGGYDDIATYILVTAGVISRALLVGLMLASLRALPCSAYEPVDWTSYIPHL